DYANYGYDEIVNHDERYDRMEEFIGVCRALWGSVEPDAMVRDEATGQVGDAAKVHDVEHRGKFFEISGPLNTPPSPQGRPVLLQAGNSPRGVRASAYVADMVFGADMPLELQIKQRKMLDDALISMGATRRLWVWSGSSPASSPRPRPRRRRDANCCSTRSRRRASVSISRTTAATISRPAAALHARPTAWRDHRQPGLARRLHVLDGDPARRGHRDHSRRILRLRPAVRDQLHAHDRRHRGAGRRHPRREVRGDGQPWRVHARPCRVDAVRPRGDRRPARAGTAAARPVPS
ncbi:MAG: LLM class flavin-dependent oxidoreductase, partial [Alphaproteobacteria bacterium]|nr:LLM class flavin-dependent oxidoreductase [Alphaproteobacteria bacterium]